VFDDAHGRLEIESLFGREGIEEDLFYGGLAAAALAKKKDLGPSYSLGRTRAAHCALWRRRCAVRAHRKSKVPSDLVRNRPNALRPKHNLAKHNLATQLELNLILLFYSHVQRRRRCTNGMVLAFFLIWGG
jgi:hypothetical protein